MATFCIKRYKFWLIPQKEGTSVMPREASSLRIKFWMLDLLMGGAFDDFLGRFSETGLIDKDI